jgi:ribosomal subunit interface protein
MDLRIRAKDFQLTPAIEQYVQQRVSTLEKMLGHDGGISRCEVELGRSAGAQRHGEYVWLAEIQVIHPGGTRVVARNQEATVQAAIDMAKDEAMRQLRNQKRLHRRVLRHTGAAVKRWLRLNG